MARMVKLVAQDVTTGHRVEVGRAELETINGSRMVVMTINNPEMIRVIGGTKVQGILTNYTEPEEPEEGTDEEVSP